MNKQEIQRKDDHLHLEEFVKKCSAESGWSVEQLEREIAERRRVGSELEETERRFRLLANSITDVIWTLDWEGGIYVSPSVERLLRQS